MVFNFAKIIRKRRIKVIQAQIIDQLRAENMSLRFKNNVLSTDLQKQIHECKELKNIIENRHKLDVASSKSFFELERSWAEKYNKKLIYHAEIISDLMRELAVLKNDNIGAG